MFFEKDTAYEVGTFELGQKVYHIRNIEHIYRFMKCSCCDNTGSVFIKGMKYNCPSCKGLPQTKYITEQVVESNPDTIRSIISLKNNKEQLEVYTTDKSGMGLIICKQDDGSDTYFATKKEAQEVCDKYNKEHSVYALIAKYSLLADYD